MNEGDSNIPLLRHTVATLAYRASKAVGGAPPDFGDYAGAGRTPLQILAHMGDLFDWAIALADGRHHWHDSVPLAWDQEVRRFFAALRSFDERLSSGAELKHPAERLFQGPIADALTHTGQIAMLRRLAGYKMKGENYFKADISTGNVGMAQAAPKVEF